MNGRLHLVPVPIADGPGAFDAGLVPGAVASARRCTYFLAENARSARAFLKGIGHPVPIAQLRIVQIGHEPDPRALDEWLAPVFARGAAPGEDAAVLSEAGCPGVADPGASLVARAHERGIEVMPWAGPSSILLALMAAGMNGQRFRFHGYLPQDRAELRAALGRVQREAQSGETQIFIETPYRNARLFDALLETCDAPLRLCVAVDLTGPQQRVQTRSIAQWRALGPAQRPALEKRAAVFLVCGA